MLFFNSLSWFLTKLCSSPAFFLSTIFRFLGVGSRSLHFIFPLSPVLLLCSFKFNFTHSPFLSPSCAFFVFFIFLFLILSIRSFTSSVLSPLPPSPTHLLHFSSLALFLFSQQGLARCPLGHNNATHPPPCHPSNPLHRPTPLPPRHLSPHGLLRSCQPRGLSPLPPSHVTASHLQGFSCMKYTSVTPSRASITHARSHRGCLKFPIKTMITISMEFINLFLSTF